MSKYKVRSAVFAALALVSNSMNAGERAETRSQYIAPYAGNKVVIDGTHDEAVWQLANWHPIAHQWLGSIGTAGDFKGQYKVLWSPAKLYLLVEVSDDNLIEKSDVKMNPFLSGDGVKVFIDEDFSGGSHEFDKNANVYHINLENEALTVDEPNHVVYYSKHINSQWTEREGKYIWEMEIDIYPDVMSSGDAIDEKVRLFGGKNMGFMIAYSDDDGKDAPKALVGSEHLEIAAEQRDWVDASTFGKLLLSK